MNSGSATIINGKVYYGGGLTTSLSKDDDIADNIVYCYDPTLDSWTPLPPLPVKLFSLGQINNEHNIIELVATGGAQRKRENEILSTVHTFDEQSKRWEVKIPPMPTARCIHGVLSLQSALVVAGGQINSFDDSDSYTNSVEVFKLDEKQWYRAKPLPVCLFNMSLVLLHGTCYVIGGYRDRVLCQVYFITVEALLNNTVHADQTTDYLDGIWNTLHACTPNSQPAAVALAGYLLTIGGTSKDADELPQKEVYIYSPSSSTWDPISCLDTSREICTAIGISSLEILVIGGWTPEDGDKKTVVKGRLQFLPKQ